MEGIDVILFAAPAWSAQVFTIPGNRYHNLMSGLHLHPGIYARVLFLRRILERRFMSWDMGTTGKEGIREGWLLRGGGPS